jgi:outer membrane receptor for ferrienterochelin and colicin
MSQKKSVLDTITIVTFSFLCTVNCVFAEQQGSADLLDFSLQELMNVEIVSASQKTETILESPSNITVVTDEQIKEWGARNLKDVLSRVAGFYILPDRDEWVISARGNISDNNQKYLILIDGHKMNSIDNFGPGHLMELPMDLANVKRIEIIRGPGSVVWGSGALAGVINIITKTAADLGAYNHEVSGTWGEDKTYKTNFQMGRAYTEGDWYMFGSFGQSEGKRITQSAATTLPILDTSTGYSSHPYGTYTTAMDKFDDSYMMQFKGRYQKWSFNGMALNSAFYNRHFEIGKGRENYLSNERYFTEAAYTDELGDWDFTWKTFFGYNRFAYDERKWTTGIAHSSQRTWQDQSAGTSVSLQRELSDKLSFNSGVEYTYTRCGPDGLLGSRTYFEDNNLGGYAIFDYLLTDEWKTTFGTGVNYNDDRGIEEWVFSPRGGLIWDASKDTTFKWLFNKAFLRPAVFQMTGPDVDSETMTQYEFIWMQRAGKGNITTTFYHQEVEGFLNIVSLGGTSQFANSGDYTQKGVEVEYTTPLFDDHTFWANASYGKADAKKFPAALPYNSIRTDPDGDLLNYPDLMFNIGSTFRFYDKKIFVSPAVRYIASTQYRATPATTPELTDAVYHDAGPFTYLDLTIGYEPKPNLGMYLGINNLTDIRSDTCISIWNGTIEQAGRYVEFKMVYRF